VKLIAIHSIRVNWDGTRRVTGRFDAAGEPIIRSVATKIQPSEIFVVPESHEHERRWLLEVGAARELTEVESALDERK